MDKVELLLIINSILLSILGCLFLLIGYFLKDLHKEFKKLIEKVNTLYSDHHTQVTLFEKLAGLFENRLNQLTERVKNLEKKKGDQ